MAGSRSCDRSGWSPENLAIAVEMKAKGSKNRDIARYLNERFEKAFSYRLVCSKLQAAGSGTLTKTHYSEEAETYIKGIYSIEAAQTVCQQLKSRFQIQISVSALYWKARSMGLDYRCPSGDFTLTDAARHLGVSRETIATYARKHPGAIYGNAKARFIREWALEAIARAHPRPVITEPVMSVNEVCRAVGLCRTVIYGYVRAGRLKAYFTGRRWHISVASADALRKEMGIIRPLPQMFNARPPLIRAKVRPTKSNYHEVSA